jgi:hypothetical protein
MTSRILFEILGVPLILLLAMGVAVQAGATVRRRSSPSDDKDENSGVVDGAIFGLMGLLLAFAFTGAASRFDGRRSLIVEEVNDIGTAYLRLDLTSLEAQPLLRQKFREYVESRIETFRDVGDTARVSAGQARTVELQQEIWSLSVLEAQKAPNTMTGMLLLPSLNEMFDITTTRLSATQMHPPLQVSMLLLLVMVLCAVLAGYRMGAGDRKSTLHRMAFIIVLALTYYAIADLEYPRVGFIRVESFDHYFLDLLNTFK